MSVPRVFIPQEPHKWDAMTGTQVPLYNFGPALRYGTLVVCLPPNVSFQMTSPVATALLEKMRDFRETDYLIAVGSPLVILLSGHIALTKTGGKLNLLTFDRRENEYLNNRIEL
jgi:hypothetical protein